MFVGGKLFDDVGVPGDGGASSGIEVRPAMLVHRQPYDALTRVVQNRLFRLVAAHARLQ